MKRFTAIAAISLAACSRQPGSDNRADAIAPTPATSDTPSPPAMTEATPAAPAPPEGAGLPPADGPQPRYVGSWAATKQLCASGAWRFGATHLTTAGEVSCDYPRGEAAPGGYDLHATCTAEGPAQPDLIKLRFAESAQAMLVDSKTFKSVGLTYCGPID